MQEHLSNVSRIAGSALLISILPAVVAGQDRSVVSNQLAISQTEAALHLEFADDGTLDIALRDGSVTIDGEERGSFEPGDALFTAWRSLLGEIATLSDGPLREALQSWEAPSSLDEEALELAQLLDRTLEDALTTADVAASAEPESVVVVDGTVPLRIEELADLSTRIRLEIREEIQSELRSEIRVELRDELRRELENVGEQSRSFRPFRAVGRGVGEVFGALITFLVLSLLALGTVAFAKDNLVVVADTARRTPMKAGMVGLAGAFLVLPAWVLGIVALVASVVGIIALPFWLLLFPVVVVLGAGLGYLAVARNIGEWVAARNIERLDWLKPTNTFYAVAAGIGALLTFGVASSILDVVPFFGFFSGLVATLGSMALAATVLIGFGAVLLTRGGREADFYGSDAPYMGETWKDEGVSEEIVDAEEVSDESAGAESTEGEDDA